MIIGPTSTDLEKEYALAAMDLKYNTGHWGLVAISAYID
jgi:hypothetical protein